MTRIVYVAGKYRHYHSDDSYDLPKMEAEVKAEERWTRIVAECGMMWVGPLANSVHLEDNPPFEGDEFVRRDLALIRCLRPCIDLILMRAGWDEGRKSFGATAEYQAARNHGLIVVHTNQGENKVREYLSSLNGEGST